MSLVTNVFCVANRAHREELYYMLFVLEVSMSKQCACSTVRKSTVILHCTHAQFLSYLHQGCVDLKMIGKGFVLLR